MASAKLTKTELKAQSDALKRYQRYLPTLKLKQQQLQLVINTMRTQQQKVTQQLQRITDEIETWVAVFADSFSFEDHLSVEELSLGEDNIAGIDIVLFKDIQFAIKPYEVLETPFWLEKGMDAVKENLRLRTHIAVLEDNIHRLQEELRVTIQRINLFEQILIPKTKEHIRKIRIFLGDQQTASVVRGKIAKRKLVGASA